MLPHVDATDIDAHTLWEGGEVECGRLYYLLPLIPFIKKNIYIKRK